MQAQSGVVVDVASVKDCAATTGCGTGAGGAGGAAGAATGAGAGFGDVTTLRRNRRDSNALARCNDTIDVRGARKLLNCAVFFPARPRACLAPRSEVLPVVTTALATAALKITMHAATAATSAKRVRTAPPMVGAHSGASLRSVVNCGPRSMHPCPGRGAEGAIRPSSSLKGVRPMCRSGPRGPGFFLPRLRVLVGSLYRTVGASP